MTDRSARKSRRLSTVGRVVVWAAAFVTLALVAPSHAAAAPYLPVRVTPEVPTAVSEPLGIAVDPFGYVVVADTGNDRVAVFSSAGNLVREIRANAQGGLGAPSAIAIGPDGYYIADTENDRILVFSASGDFVRRLPASGSIDAPVGVAVSSNGTVFATSGHADTITVCYTDGTVESWGSLDPVVGLSGRFVRPTGLAASNGLLYVADKGNQRVQVLNSSNGGYVDQWGPSGPTGSSYSRYVSPTGVTVAPNGDIFVADRFGYGGWVDRSSAVSPYSSLALWGITPQAAPNPPVSDGTLREPNAAAAAADGTIYFADTGNDRIARYGGSAWLAPWRAGGSSAGRLDGPHSLTVLPDGSALVADTGNSRASLFSIAGEFLGTMSGPGDAEEQLRSPGGAAIGPDGDRYIADTGHNRISRFSPAGALRQTFGASVLSSPKGVAFDASGNLYVADSGHSRVARFTADGGYLGSWGSTGTADGQFMRPSDLAVDDSDNAIWVADTGNHRVQKISLTSGAFRAKSPAVVGAGDDPGQFTFPAGLCIDPDRGVIVADTGNDRIQRLDRAARFVEEFGARGVQLGEMHQPVDVEQAGPGRLWVLESAGARLQQFLRDPDPPSVSAVGAPAVPVNTPVTISVVASDAITWVSSIYYRVDSSAPMTYTAPITISSEGSHVVGWWAVDYAGNISAEQTAAVIIDVTPPSGTLSLAGGYWNPADPMTLASTVTGAASVRVGVDGAYGGWQAYAAGVDLPRPSVDGTYSADAQYRDAVGNVLTLHSEFGVDTTGPEAPVISSATHPSGVLVRGGTTASFAWNRPDDLAGTSGYSYALDRLPATVPVTSIVAEDPAASFSGLTGGEWYLHVRSVDVLGNWGETAHYPIALSSAAGLSEPRLVRAVIAPGTTTFKYYGAVGHAHDDCRVTLYAFRLESGRWVERASSSALVTPSTGGLRYRGTLALTPGQWRVRAVHPHHDYVENESTLLSAPFQVR